MSRVALLLPLLSVSLSLSAKPQDTPTYEVVVLSQGDVKFPLQPADKDQYGQYCDLNVCTCESDVSYVQFRAPATSNALALINGKLKAEASQVSCSYPDATDTMQQKVTHVSARFVSVVEHSYSQQIATGGSCHGSSAVHTYDLTSGKEYKLADIISKSSLVSLRSTLPGAIVRGHNHQVDEMLEEEEKANSTPGSSKVHKAFAEPPEESARYMKSARQAVASIGDQELLGSEVFIQNGRVFVNIGGYYFGCVGGPFHPAEIPASFMTLPALRRELAGK